MMILAPLAASGFAIQVHTIAASFAVVLGAFVLWRQKGTALHKALGRVWIVLMLVTATSAIFINEIRLIGPFSPIHLFTIITYLGVFSALRAIIVKRDVARHRAEMQGLYVGALVLAGAFTLLPGRRMHEVLFGREAGWPPSLIAIGLILSLVMFMWLRWRRRALSLPLPTKN
jgi:uncharacterized membrane protein